MDRLMQTLRPSLCLESNPRGGRGRRRGDLLSALSRVCSYGGDRRAVVQRERGKVEISRFLLFLLLKYRDLPPPIHVCLREEISLTELLFLLLLCSVSAYASDAYESGVDSTRSRLQAIFFRLDSTRFVKLKSRLFFPQNFGTERRILKKISIYFSKLGHRKRTFILMCLK